MAFAGLKKQFNKANQLINEKIGGIESTKLDDEYLAMEKKTDRLNELVDDLQTKTREYLQPSSTTRAKVFSKTFIGSSSSYSQPEGVLGDCLVSHGGKFAVGDNEAGSKILSQALLDTGKSMQELAGLRYSLDDKVKQEFFCPLQELSVKLKDVNNGRDKVMSKRSDFDVKRNKVLKTPQSSTTLQEEEIKLAAKKFSESLHLTRVGMHELLETEAGHTGYLLALAEAISEYHQQCAQVTKELTISLRARNREAAYCPKKDFMPVTLPVLEEFLKNGNNNHVLKSPTSPKPKLPPPYRQNSIGSANSQQSPCCRALYDFTAGNGQEISLNEGDVIELISKVDENWYEGKCHGRTGYFPVSYVEVIVPLPR